MRRLKFFLLILWVLLLPLGTASAQSPVSAELSTNSLTTDDEVTLIITVSGDLDGPPDLPQFEGLRIVGTSSSSQTTIINGAVSSQAAYYYTLRPFEAGLLTIGSVTVTIDGQQFSTDPMTVNVTQGVLPAEQNNNPSIVPPTELTDQNFYVEAIIDNENPYLGQQLSYIFRFYQAVELRGRPTYSAPEFVGFWNPQETQQTQSLSQIGERTYRITELRSPLFPTIPGVRDIDSAEFTLPDNTTLLTEPQSVTVRPLPQPAPDEFAGAVGRYAIGSEVDLQQVEIGEPVTLRVQINGIGNIETLPQPNWPELDGWRSYENQNVVNTEFSDGIIAGRRFYEYIYIPSQAGSFTIPAISYTYFDPDTESYEVIATAPYDIQVVGSVGGETDPAVAAPVDVEDNREILTIKPVPRTLRGDGTSLTARMGFWALWAIPLAILVGDWAYRWQTNRRTDDPIAKRRNNARRTARRAIKAAAKENSADADRILINYLADKKDVTIGGLTREARADKLMQMGVSAGLVEQINGVFDSAETIRFGGTGTDSSQLMSDTDDVVNALDKELS